MIRAYKYRIYPTKEQAVLLNKTFGCCRWVYNRALAAKIKHYQETGKSLSIYECMRELPLLKGSEETRWLSEVNSQALVGSLRNLDTAYVRFFKEKRGFPKFKSKSGRDSFSSSQGTKVDFDMKRVYLTKFSEGIKCKFHRTFDGKVKTSTVSKTKTGKFFISINVETTEVEPETVVPTLERTLGIDLGIKHYAALSDGTKVANPSFLKKKLSYLRRQQRKLSRKKKGSGKREKQRLIVARAYEKVTDARNNFLHNLTARLVKNQDYDAFAVENLGVQDMMKNKRMARQIGDAAWFQFRAFLEYKAKRVGKSVLVIGRFEPSSKTCTCGHVNHGLSLKDREWTCPLCNTLHDRDLLAANNIRRFAFNKHDTYKTLVGTLVPEFTPVETELSSVVETGKVKRKRKT